MFDTAERAQIRAALHLWMEAGKNSKTHPSEFPVCKAEFLTDNVLPLTVVQIESIIAALETEMVYITVPLAAEKYSVDSHRLRQQLRRSNITPIPGSHVYRLIDVMYAVNLIREANSRGFFG